MLVSVTYYSMFRLLWYCTDMFGNSRRLFNINIRYRRATINKRINGLGMRPCNMQLQKFESCAFFLSLGSSWITFIDLFQSFVCIKNSFLPPNVNPSSSCRMQCKMRVGILISSLVVTSVLNLFIGCSIYRVVFIFTLGFCVFSAYARRPCSEGEARAMHRHASAATAALNIAPSAEHNGLAWSCLSMSIFRMRDLRGTVNE